VGRAVLAEAAIIVPLVRILRLIAPADVTIVRGLLRDQRAVFPSGRTHSSVVL
jgi:hypothetical protein